MKRWLAVCGLAASGAVVGVACAGAGSGAPDVPCPQVAEAGTGEIASEETKGNHAQSAKLRGDGLEEYQFFVGTIGSNGNLAPLTPPADPTKFEIQAGKFVNGVPTRAKDLRVRKVSSDPCVPYDRLGKDSSNNMFSLPLYRVRTEAGKNLCAPFSPPLVDAAELASCSGNTPGEQVLAHESLAGLAVAVAGYWDDSGNHRDTLPGDEWPVVTLSCMSAVVAKCAHWGYLPWGKSKEGKNLKGHHIACAAAARAAYGKRADTTMAKDGAYTCSRTVVDIYDSLASHVQDRAENNNYSDESYWDASGLRCLARTRYECTDKQFKLDEGRCATPPGGWLIAVRGISAKLDGNSERCPGVEEDACEYE